MKLLITADTHFGHKRMIEKEYRKEGFEGKILQEIKDKVGNDTVLIHLGDICIGDDSIWNSTLNCIAKQSWLIKGNHDSKSMMWYLAHDWDFVSDAMVIVRHGKRILFTHEPVPKDDTWDINVHGHLHSDKRDRHGFDKIKHNGHLLVCSEGNEVVFDLDRLIVKKIRDMNKNEGYIVAHCPDDEDECALCDKEAECDKGFYQERDDSIFKACIENGINAYYKKVK